jgi:hypothetical protein
MAADGLSDRILADGEVLGSGQSTNVIYVTPRIP